MIKDYNDQPLTNCHGGSTVIKILAHNASDSHEARSNRKRKAKNHVQSMNQLAIYLELRYGSANRTDRLTRIM